jgi:dolichol-phosphate mannosyltransferase
MTDMTLPNASTDFATSLTYQYVPPDLAVVVPTFNERANVELLYESLSTALEGVSWELIVVDDNSPDETAAAVKDLSRRYGNVRCLRRLGRRGLSSACIEGIMATAAPFVAIMDADHQHDERILPAMLASAEAGADLVIGSRFVGGGSAGNGLSSTRLKGSELATRLSGMIAGNGITDPMSGYFLVKRDLFERVAPDLASDGFKILLDLIVTAKRSGVPLKVAEVPYTFRPRHAGESKMSPLVVIQFVGLWFSKLTGGLVPTSFLLFAMVGISGVAVHLAVLMSLVNGLGVPFVAGQIAATLTAMTWNFALNNTLTYADRRLHGARLWKGLVGFYVICSLGGIANISVAAMIYEFRHATLIAGLAGAVMSSVFNYAVTRIVTWRA